jgi:predicted secreted protein
MNIELRSPGSSGYVWTFQPSVAAEWRLIDRQSRPGSLFGGRSCDTVAIEVLKPGRATIAAELKRPWEDEAIERLEIAVDAS